MNSVPRSATMLALHLLWSWLLTTSAQDTDQFTYNDVGQTAPNNVYAPSDWGRVECHDLATCPGWPEKFLASQDYADYTLTENSCLWCPADGSSHCPTHHQSPINLDRDRDDNSTADFNPCIDVHFMRYYDSSCTWDELLRLNAFSIQRHALQIVQPLEVYDGLYRTACADANGDHYFGRFDYSKGFSDWWYLSNTDFHVPSEHTQNGKRYDAEMQMYMFYSVNQSMSKDDVPNQMGAVSIFLEAYDNATDFDMLNKVICQWRRVEDATRAACGLPSVNSSYAGCTDYTRGQRALRAGGAPPQAAVSLGDVLREYHDTADATDREPLVMDDDGFSEEELDWAEFIREVYRAEEERRHGRHLSDYEQVGPWNNWFGMLEVKTEYYFRYSGSQTIPPCFGPWTPGPTNRANTTHWRVLKDPIRVTSRQIDEMHRLLKDRIAPVDDPIRACQSDTAARPSDDGNPNHVNVSRPLQATDVAHFMVFCECRWKSHWVEDQTWCAEYDHEQRLYEHPYNFPSNGF